MDGSFRAADGVGDFAGGEFVEGAQYEHFEFQFGEHLRQGRDLPLRLQPRGRPLRQVSTSVELRGFRQRHLRGAGTDF